VPTPHLPSPDLQPKNEFPRKQERNCNSPEIRASTLETITMKRLVTAFAIAFASSAILMTSAMAQTIGVSLSSFDHLFLVTVREAMTAKAKELGVDIQFEDAQGDIGKQLNQI
jgi:hypothetical protein